jgi:hypothetical protein
VRAVDARVGKDDVACVVVYGRRGMSTIWVGRNRGSVFLPLDRKTRPHQTCKIRKKGDLALLRHRLLRNLAFLWEHSVSHELQVGCSSSYRWLTGALWGRKLTLPIEKKE